MEIFVKCVDYTMHVVLELNKGSFNITSSKFVSLSPVLKIPTPMSLMESISRHKIAK